MAKLDRKKPFGQVYGMASHSFEQDGALFDQDGEEVVVDTKGAKAPAKAKKAAEPAPLADVPVEADSQLASQLNG